MHSKWVVCLLVCALAVVAVLGKPAAPKSTLPAKARTPTATKPSAEQVQQAAKIAATLSDEQLTDVFINTITDFGEQQLAQRQKTGDVNITQYVKKWEKVTHLMMDLLLDSIKLETNYSRYPSMVRVGIARTVEKPLLNASSGLISVAVWANQISSTWNLIEGLRALNRADIDPRQLPQLVETSDVLKSKADQFSWTHEVFPEILRRMSNHSQPTFPTRPTKATTKKPAKKNNKDDDVMNHLSKMLGDGIPV